MDYEHNQINMFVIQLISQWCNDIKVSAWYTEMVYRNAVMIHIYTFRWNPEERVTCKGKLNLLGRQEQAGYYIAKFTLLWKVTWLTRGEALLWVAICFWALLWQTARSGHSKAVELNPCLLWSDDNPPHNQNKGKLGLDWKCKNLFSA